MGTKKCTKCNVEKNLTEYSIHKQAKDGLQHNCKTCNLAYRIANRNKIRERDKAYSKQKRLQQINTPNPKKVKISDLISSIISFVNGR